MGRSGLLTVIKSTLPLLVLLKPIILELSSVPPSSENGKLRRGKTSVPGWEILKLPLDRFLRRPGWITSSLRSSCFVSHIRERVDKNYYLLSTKPDLLRLSHGNEPPGVLLEADPESVGLDQGKGLHF